MGNSSRAVEGFFVTQLSEIQWRLAPLRSGKPIENPKVIWLVLLMPSCLGDTDAPTLGPVDHSLDSMKETYSTSAPYPQQK